MNRRKDQLKLCEKCENKSFDSKKGTICSLTDEQPDFIGTCSDFKEKESVKKYREYSNKVSSDISNIDRYPALKSIIGILNIFAWIVGIITVILTIFSIFGALNMKNIDVSYFVPITTFLIQGLFVSLILIAISESIKVILDIEKNTRNS
jgi:hypothetical protein